MNVRGQIIYSRVQAVVRELSETVGRTARSPGLTEGRRYAAALLTGEGKLAAQVHFGPQHAYLIRDSVAAVRDRFAFNLFDGDVVIVGDPYSGGSTPQMVTIVAPLFFESELVLIPAVRAQMADLAGEFPGDLHPFASETWQDAVRFTPLKLYRHGAPQRDAFRFLLRNSRAEALVAADIESIVAALRAASASLLRLLREHGRRPVEGAVASAIVHSRRVAAAYVAERFADVKRAARIEFDGDGRTLSIALRIVIDGEALALDFGGTDADPSGPFNMTSGHARGYGLVAAFAERLDEIAFNDGLLELVTIEAPSGSLVNAAPPSATGLSDALTGHKVAALVRAALGLADRLDGPSPAIVAFLPIGVEVNAPLALDVGFPLSGQGWGAPLLAGRRMMPSAEELEARERLILLSRELTSDGLLCAALRNDRTKLEANFFLPSGDNGAGFGLTAGDGRRRITSSTLVELPEGSLLDISYPAYGVRHGG